MSIKEVCEGLPVWAHYLIFIALFLWEFWLGKTKLVKAGSSVELVMNVFKKEKNMEVSKGLEIDLKDGKIVLSYDLKQVAVPVLDGLVAKVESGEIDPIKGTDLDKDAMLKALAFLKAELLK